MNDQKPGIASEAFWLRIIFMLLFVVAYQIAEIILAVIVLLQVIYVAVSGQRNLFLQQSGAGFSAYAYQIYRYLTYNGEEKPFPFSRFPEGEAPDRDPYQSGDQG